MTVSLHTTTTSPIVELPLDYKHADEIYSLLPATQYMTGTSWRHAQGPGVMERLTLLYIVSCTFYKYDEDDEETHKDDGNGVEKIRWKKSIQILMWLGKGRSQTRDW